MQRNATAVLIYSLAAVAVALFWITRQPDGSWKAALLSWLLMFAAPLLFVFAYPRFLFDAVPAHATRPRSASIVHGLAATITTIIFVALGSAFWKNPMRDADSILLLAVPLVAVPMFLVAALSLLFKNNSTLAKFASFLFWPYWLLLALSLVGRFFEASLSHSTFCFLCLLTPILFAFAAGAISYRPAIAHASAFAGLLAMPWIYWTALQGTPLGNVWTMFNAPDRELLMYGNLRIAELTIFFDRAHRARRCHCGSAAASGRMELSKDAPMRADMACFWRELCLPRRLVQPICDALSNLWCGRLRELANSSNSTRRKTGSSISRNLHKHLGI